MKAQVWYNIPHTFGASCEDMGTFQGLDERATIRPEQGNLEGKMQGQHRGSRRSQSKPMRRPEFNVGDKLPGNDQYIILDSGERKSDKARPLGTGSAGVAYLASYKNMRRVIKFLSPDPWGDQQAQLPIESLEKAFEKEIRLLSTLTHTHIVKIVDFGESMISETINGTTQEKTYPYYVMEYVEGKPFKDYWKNCSAREFLHILDEILDALEFLHMKEHYHMDVKEENIRVQTFHGSESKAVLEPHAILLDLGGAKHVPKQLEMDEDQTVYVSTEKATRPGRRRFLGRNVSKDDLRKWGPDLDLYAVGTMIQRALEESSLAQRVKTELGSSAFEALEWVVNRLVEGEDNASWDNRYYKTVRQLRDDLRAVLPEYTWPFGLQELNLVVGPRSVQIPGCRVGLTDDLMEIINHPLFQRLRNIPQLEYAHLVYPGARHSRLHHSLLAFEMARSFMSRLLDFPSFRMRVRPEHIQATLLVSLLHDVGHYPLSHMFEDFAERSTNISSLPPQSVPSDEALFRSFVCPEENDNFKNIIYDKLKSDSSSTVLSLHKLVEQRFPKAYELLPQIMYPRSNASPPFPLLHALVSSAIDIDKVAYLTVDSLMTGVPFGQGIDITGLIDALVPPRTLEDEMAGKIAITEDGLVAAESLVLARFWMISRVYWHRTHRAIMAMHKFVIADLMRLRRLNFNEYFKETLFSTQEEATAMLAKLYDDAHPPADRGDEQVRNPLHGVLGSRREIYGRILTFSKGPDEEDRVLYEHISKAEGSGIIDIAELLRTNRGSPLAKYRLRYGDLLVDIPLRGRDYLGSSVLVYLDRKPGKAFDLIGGHAPVSQVLAHIPQDFEHHVKKCRIYIHPEVEERLNRECSIEELRKKIRDFLLDRYQ